MDRLKTDAEKSQKKKELTEMIYRKYLVGKSTRELRESGLPKIMEIAFVGCPPTGRAEGVSELRQTLYDVAFSLTVPKGMYVILVVCVYVYIDVTYINDMILYIYIICIVCVHVHACIVQMVDTSKYSLIIYV